MKKKIILDKKLGRTKSKEAKDPEALASRVEKDSRAK